MVEGCQQGEATQAERPVFSPRDPCRLSLSQALIHLWRTLKSHQVHSSWLALLRGCSFLKCFNFPPEAIVLVVPGLVQSLTWCNWCLYFFWSLQQIYSLITITLLNFTKPEIYIGFLYGCHLFFPKSLIPINYPHSHLISLLSVVGGDAFEKLWHVKMACPCLQSYIKIILIVD